MVNAQRDTELVIVAPSAGTTVPVERAPNGSLTYEAYCAWFGVDARAARQATLTKALFAMLAAGE